MTFIKEQVKHKPTIRELLSNDRIGFACLVVAILILGPIAVRLGRGQQKRVVLGRSWVTNLH